MTKTLTRFEHLKIKISGLFRASCFGFRISYSETNKVDLKPSPTTLLEV
jgi:hypothetical protein